MKRTLPFFSMVAILVTLFVNPPTALAQVNNHVMKYADKQLFIEKAVIDYTMKECFYVCEGTRVPVTKWQDGKYHIADGTEVPDTYVHCYGKAVDKVATANSTANRAEKKADRALAENAKEKGAVDKAQATADSALARLNAMIGEKNACLDSIAVLRDQLTLISSSYTTLNNSYVNLDSLLQDLWQNMPADQSKAIEDLQWQTSELDQVVEILIAHDFSTSSKKLDKIVTKAIELDPDTKIVKRFKR